MSLSAAVEDILEEIGPDDSEYESSGDEYIPSREDLRDFEEEFGPPRKKMKKKMTVKNAVSVSSDDDDDDEVPLAVLRDRQNEANGWEDEDDLPLKNFALTEVDGMEDDLAALPIWTDTPFQTPDVPFTGMIEPAAQRLKTPFQYFKDMITDDMIEHIQTQTNIYSMQKEGKVIGATSKEIEIFIGIYLRMGLVQAYSVRAYWAAFTRYAPVADSMGRDRFMKLATCIHFDDNTKVTEEEKRKDKIWKIRPWLDHLQRSFEKIIPEEHQAVDEIVIAFKGHSGLKQYLRLKPKKWGFKMWARCGSSGIVYQMDVYQGANPQKVKTPLGVGGEVVLQMTSKLAEGKNFKIFADNFFTNLALVKALKEKGMWFIGTVRVNRLKGCKLKTEKELKQEGRGSSHTLVELNTGASATRWFDNRCVDLVSTYKGVEPQEAVRRWDKKEKQYMQINCPASVKEYNKFMGGVDLLDSLTALYKYPIKTRRWYMYIFYHTIAMAVVNAWLLYKRHCKSMNLKPMKLADFQSEVSDGLISTRRPAGRPVNVSPPGTPAAPATPATPIPKTLPQRQPSTHIRFDHVDHLPQWGKRGRCKNKGCEGLTFIICTKCGVSLCLNKDRNCFAAYHVQKN